MFRLNFISESFKNIRKTGRQRRARFVSFFQMRRIIGQRQRKWKSNLVKLTLFLLFSKLTYDQIYAKVIEPRKMNNKLSYIYPDIMTIDALLGLQIVNLKPKSIEQLSNLISMSYRYHYRIIADNELSIGQKEKISFDCDTKCLFLNISELNRCEVNPNTHILTVELGAKSKNVNKFLSDQGYEEIIPQEFDQQNLHDVVTNNLPLRHSSLARQITSLELISGEGANFRATGDSMRYGQIPSLLSFFLGTGGAYAFPAKMTIKVKRKQPLQTGVFSIDNQDINERIISLRKIQDIYSDLVETNYSNNDSKTLLACRAKMPHFSASQYCENLLKQNGIAYTRAIAEEPRKFNLMFSASRQMFQIFLLRHGWDRSYSYQNGLLKVMGQTNEDMLSIISTVTNENGVFVWCVNKNLFLKTKPSVDSTEVGAEMMRKLVEVRQGIDHRKVFYSHNRYENYFRKGFLRKLTQYFW